MTDIEERIEALETTKRLWLWLAANPRKRKHEWPEWEKNGGKVPDSETDCPCCNYTGFDKWRSAGQNVACSKCPLNGYAWRVFGSRNVIHCECSVSIWEAWRMVWMPYLEMDVPGPPSFEDLLRLNRLALAMAKACVRAIRGLTEDLEGS